MTARHHHLRGVLLAAAGAACWSPDGLIMRTVHADAWQALFWRMMSFTVALLFILAIKERGALVAAFRAVRGPGLLTGALMAAVNACFIFSITHTAVANTLVILSTVPLFGAGLGWFFLRERVPLRTIGAIVVALGSIVAIFAEKLGHGSVHGDLFAAAAACLFAGNLTVVRKHPDIPLLPALTIGGVLGAIIGAALSDPFTISFNDTVLLLASGSIQQTAALFLFLSGARYLPPAEVGLLNLVETVLGPFWVWLVVSERPSSVALVAGIVVIAALVLHSWLALRAEQSASAKPAG